MPIQWTSNLQKTWPPAATSVTVTTNSSAWVSGSYATVEAAASSDAVLTAIVVRPITGTAAEFEIDVATGAAASEVVIATVHGKYLGDGTQLRFVFAIPVDAIASGTRISARARASVASAVSYAVGLQYYEKPITGNMLVSAKPIKVVPSAASATNLAGGASVWGWGSWTEMVASTSTAIVVDGVLFFPSATSGEGEVQIGTGTAGNEVPVAHFRGAGASVGGLTGYLPMMNPLDNIAASVRVSARLRHTTGSGLGTCRFAIHYREKPL